MKARTRTATAAGGLVAASALLTACGAGGGDGYGNAAGGYSSAPVATASSASAAPAPSVKKSVSEPAEVAPALQLVAAQTKALGWVVTDGKGWILYRFDKDRSKPTPQSMCTGACAQKWPPVLVHGKPALKGVSAKLVGKVRRADGTWQLTLHGWPVYRFAGDAKPGQWKGQAVGGTWYAIKRNGARNTVLPGAAAAAPAAAQPTITDGYGNSSSY
jgi:predicted lipoprotein with Yx(FWY)xxD motif